MRCVLAIAAWLLVGGEAHAQSGQSAKAAKAAGDAFEKGRALMAAKKYAEACAAFELSQRLDPQYGTQFNLAGCHVAQDKLATAWKLYRELARSDSNTQRRKRSGELADQLAKRVPKLRIRVDQQLEGLSVVVGATDVTPLIGADIPFDAGHYAIEARLPGHLPFREEIDLEAGSQAREIAVVFEREPAVAERAEGPRADPRRGRYGKIAAAGGGGLVAFGLIAGWRALANHNASRELCNTTRCLDRLGAEALTDRARLWGNLSTASVVLGAVGIAGGVYLWRTSRSRSVRVDAAAAPASVSLVVGGDF